MISKVAILALACTPLWGWSQPVDPEVIRSQACAAPNRMPNDEDAKADKRLYLGIGINAAICVAGAPTSRQMSNGGQLVDALEYGDGRILRFTYNQLATVTTATSESIHPPLPSVPEGRCAIYVGTSVTPLSFDRAVAGLPKISPQGEFESTADYQARVSAIESKRTLIVSKPWDEKIRYNPDERRFEVRARDFGSHYGAKITLSESDRQAGNYVGTNAFGVRVRVERIERSRRALSFQGDHLSHIFPGAKEQDVVGVYPASPADAKRLQAQFKLAFVLKPKAPFLEHQSFRETKPTIDNPEEVRVHETTMVSDIQCGLLLDGGNKVLAAYATQKPK